MADSKTSIIISAEDRTRAAFESARNGLRGLEAAASRLPVLGAALATAFSGAAFTAAIRDAIKFTASLDDMSEKTGASVETLSGLARVAQIGGHELGLVEQSTIKLAKGLAEADNESSGAARALKALGLSAAELRGMDTGQALKVVADRLNQFEDGAGKSALAMDLLGKSGAQALPFLKDLAEQGDLVVTTTTEQAAAAERYEKNINRLKVQVDELARSLATQLVPALNNAMELMNRPGVGVSGALSTGLDRTLFGGDYAARIRELQDDLSGLESAKSAPGSMLGGGWFGAIADSKIAQLKATIEGLKALQAADALSNNAASYSNEGRAAGMQSLSGYRSTPAENARKLRSIQDSDPLGDLLRREDEKEAERLERLRQQYIDLADPLQKYRDQLEDIATLRSRGDLTADQALAAEWEVNEQMDAAFEKMTALKESGTDTFAQLTKAVEGWGKASANAFAEFVVDGKGSISDLARHVLKEFIAMQTAPVFSDLLKGGTSFLMSLLPNADGGVYNSPSLSAYSNGVYESPHLFKFASGAGVFGEAGPEAIMPLWRGADGKLGVKSSGGDAGLTVNLIEAPGKGGAVNRRTGSNGAPVLDIMVEQIRAVVASDIRSGNGVIPAALQGTYGVNRAWGGGL